MGAGFSASINHCFVSYAIFFFLPAENMAYDLLLFISWFGKNINILS